MSGQLRRLNQGFAGSTISLDRRSNASINAIDNVSFGDEKPDNTYNTLQWSNQNNFNPTPQKGRNALYDDVGPRTGSQQNSRTSQTSKKPARAKQRRRDKIIRFVLMFLIIFVAFVALLLAIMLMMGKVGPKCSCSRSGEFTYVCIFSYQFLICC